MAAASEGVGDAAQAPEPTPPARRRCAAPPPAPAPAAAPAGGDENGKTFVSPVVARIASEHGVDPSQVRAPAAAAA